MKRQVAIEKLTAALLAGLVVLTAPGAQAARIKCWTNDEGVRECGNQVPPKYAQKGHKTMSERGVTIGETARAKTAEELEAERQAKIDEEKQRKEAERVARAKAASDRVLLDTFTTEQDLLVARDDKLAAIDSRIKHTNEVIDRLQEKLEELQGDAAKLERGGKEVPDDLRASISSIERQIDENRALIGRRHTEKQELAAQFDTDLARYRELKGAQ